MVHSDDFGLFLIQMDSKLRTDSTNIIQETFQFFLRRTHDVKVIHIPSVILLALYILNISVDPVWIENPYNLRELVADVDGFLHPLLASELRLWNTPVRNLVKDSMHTFCKFLV